jgi:hypothetical protein
MININANNISEDIISKIGLRLSDKPINAEISHHARVFEYPHLKDVFIMENDLYGNVMPKGSCFLVFCGRNGLIGKEITVEKLKNSSPGEIENLVNSNNEG